LKQVSQRFDLRYGSEFADEARHCVRRLEIQRVEATEDSPEAGRDLRTVVLDSSSYDPDRTLQGLRKSVERIPQLVLVDHPRQCCKHD
jgi:hypothetical protein